LEKNKIDFFLLGRLIKLTGPYRLIFIASGILAVILAPLAIMRPKLIQQMVDEHIFLNDLEGLVQLTLILVGVLFLEAVLRYFFTYGTSWLGESVVRDLRVRVFNHVTNLRLTYFDKTPIGTSTTRTINDIQTINDIFTQGLITIIADLLTLIAVLGIMLVTSWKLTLVCLTTLPFLMVASYIFKEKVKVSFQKVRAEISKMNAFLQERISGMRIVQIFNAEEQEKEKFRVINRRYTGANLKSILYYAIFFPVVEIISAASLGLMVWWGARGVISNEVTLGALVAFPIYLEMLFRPIRMLADKFNTLQMGLVAAERVFNLLDRKETIPNKGTLMPTKIQGHLKFDQISFAYNPGEMVLKNLTFEVKPGETLAIVGSTGSGKTTITNILNRFYEINAGRILIDNEPIESYEIFALRRRIAMVLQDVFLFSGTVYENITLRDSSITKEQVIEAAKMIGAHEFINRLPGGYDYKVMERGATLSMGQRQLISFVRALVFKPDILILDEATSSVDPETESIIQFAIEKLIDKRTSIIIAHRLSTIRHANNIMVLQKGEIIELGSHEELLKQPEGHYRKLYEMQFLEHSSTVE
jgi:ATP-binding cassette subfamily B protein